MSRPSARRTVENALRRLGLDRIAGVDEVGRGCLAGPVVAAAVVLDPAAHVPGLADSKLVPPDEREVLAALIIGRATAWAVAIVEARRDRSHSTSTARRCRRCVRPSVPLRLSRTPSWWTGSGFQISRFPSAG